MHELAFANSFRPPEQILFGVKMENYSIGHELALVRQGNPLATYTAKSFSELPTIAKRLALAMAIEVCGNVRSLFRKWRLAFLIHRLSDESLSYAIEAFDTYRRFGSEDLPMQKMPRQHGVPFHYFGAPELARLINYVADHHQTLIAVHFGGSPLNFPVGLARVLYSTQLETDGAIWIKNAQDMAHDAPKKEGTPEASTTEVVLTGEAAEKSLEEAIATAGAGK